MPWRPPCSSRWHGLARRFLFATASALTLIAVVSCDIALPAVAHVAGLESQSSPGGAEQTCAAACRARAARCSPHECKRGCSLVLDRLVQREGAHVIACVAQSTAACDDATWARCATRIGLYADGGPPAPPARKEEEDEE